MKTELDYDTGVVPSNRPNQPYLARVSYEGKTYLQKRFKTLEEAVNTRNKVIKDNSLPNTINKYKEL